MIDDPDVTILLGDARERLSELPSETVQTIVTSPPFWNLRDYGTDDWEGGLEECDHRRPRGSLGGTARSGLAMSGNYLTPEHLERKVEGYARAAYGAVCGRCGARRVASQIGLEATPEEWAASLVAVLRECRRILRPDGTLWIEVGDKYADAPGPGFKPKDLVGAPWLLAFALRADGWHLRSDTIWERPNPMPESVLDRPTKAHSYLFLLSRSDRYFYDADPIREPYRPDGRKLTTRTVGAGSHENYDSFGHEEGRERWPHPLGANARSVWTIAPESTLFAHFATMPTALVRRCIAAGSREGDLVLDPFMGAGTTALVARRMGRRAIGVELSPAYLEIARERLSQQSLFA